MLFLLSLAMDCVVALVTTTGATLSDVAGSVKVFLSRSPAEVFWRVVVAVLVEVHHIHVRDWWFSVESKADNAVDPQGSYAAVGVCAACVVG